MQEELEELRKSLDNIDNAMVYLLAERFCITNKVGLYKKKHALPPVDPAREALQFKRISKLAKTAGLDPGFAEKLLRVIIDEVVKNHRRIQEQ